MEPVRLHVGLRQALADETPVTLGTVLDRVSGPTHAVTLLLLALPFLQPLPTLGLAYPIGIATAVLGLALAAGRRAALPSFLVRQSLRRELVQGMALVAERIHRIVPARRRWPLLLRPLPAGLALASAGIVLFLPIPLPLSNFVPAVAILLLALGLVEEDGVLVAAGHALNLACCGVLWATWTQVAALFG